MPRTKLLKLLIFYFKALLSPWLSYKHVIALDPPTSQKSRSGAYMEFKPISTNEYLMGRVILAELPPPVQKNIETLLNRLNILLAAYTGTVSVSSGYRSEALNNAVGGATRSWHTHGAAIDLVDNDGTIWRYCLNNLHLCADLGIWIEDKRWTPTWIHLQIYPPKSGNRIFVPNNKPPAAPRAWDGEYNKKFDSKIAKN